MKKLFRRILVVSLLATLLLAVFSSAALAGNVCSEIKGSPRKTTSFTVTTGSGWLLGQKITLTQQKGTALGQYCGHYNKPYSTYGYFYVTIQRISGSGKTPSPISWYGKNCSISLGKNSTYKITVEPLDESMYMKHIFRGFKEWKSYPVWSVKKVRNITLCD